MKTKHLNFRGIIHEMAESEIISFIDPKKLEEIRSNDPHPLFRAYSIGHEGESVGGLVGVGKVVKRWVRGLIRELAEKVSIGTKVFFGHSADNSHSGRTVIGELVGKTLKTINDKLHTIGILYIKEDHRNANLDISSIEADAEFQITGIGRNVNADVVKVHEVSGIALANSKFQKAGFSGATLQAQIQELATLQGGEKMTVEEIKHEIQQGGFIPSEIFTKTELGSDPVIDGFVKEFAKSNSNQVAFDARKKAKEESKNAENELKQQIYELNDKLKQERATRMNVESVELLKKEMDNGRDMDDKQKAFVLLDFEKKFKVKDPDKVTDEVKSYVDDRLEELKKNMEILGIKGDGDDPTPQPSKPGIPAPTKPLKTGSDYSDPEVNDFIPRD
jgi:hypothetical protein